MHFLSYNISMMKKTQITLYALRILLLALCILSMGFILYNSIQTGEASSAQSYKAVDTVQEVAQVIAPDSKIATATGEDYEQLHIDIRDFAHFAEFALLGFSAFGCCLSFTLKKRALAIPSLFVVLFSCLDELLQTFTAGRAGQATDILCDVLGAFSGGICACIAAIIIVYIYRNKEKKNVARELGNRFNSI